MYKKHFYTAVILLLFLAVGIQPTFATITLSNSGWSPVVGDWDSVTQTGTLTQDVSETIIISNPWFEGIDENDRITLDGGGYTVDISGPAIEGIDVDNSLYVTVQNINVTGLDKNGEGISLSPSGYCNVINSTFSNCEYGIFMQEAGTCTIEGNIVSGNGSFGILIQLGSVENTLKNNTIEDNSTGLSVADGAYNNTIYNNNFINNGTQAAVYQPENLFSLPLPIGGNYWSNWTTPDTDPADGFVDDPYENNGVVDNLPWAIQNGWIAPAVLIGQMVAMVESMNLQQGIDNSLDAKLDAAVNALDDVNQNNDVAAINSLNAFINAVEAQRDNKITSAQADILIGDATDIITLLGG